MPPWFCPNGIRQSHRARKLTCLLNCLLRPEEILRTLPARPLFGLEREEGSGEGRQWENLVA